MKKKERKGNKITRRQGKEVNKKRIEFVLVYTTNAKGEKMNERNYIRY